MSDSTIVLDPASLSLALCCVALCTHCAKQRDADPSSPELVAAPAAVLSGVCHDCGGGFCLCRGILECDRCPRRNALRLPPPPSTIPRPFE
jgi:hypothetical protein